MRNATIKYLTVKRKRESWNELEIGMEIGSKFSS